MPPASTYVRPATPELKVRDPERGGHLPPAGREVPDTDYWRRRVADRDVVKGAPEAPSPAPVEDAAPAKRSTKGKE